MWSTGFYQLLSILFCKVMVSKIEFIIIRGVPERSAVILHATQIFCIFWWWGCFGYNCTGRLYYVWRFTWLPYISYIGMCRPIASGFGAVLVLKRVYTLPILVWNRVWFSRELQDRMNVFFCFNSKWVRKKEKYTNSKWIWIFFLFAL